MQIVSAIIASLAAITATALAQPATRPVTPPGTQPVAERWSVDRANAWSARQPWLCGFNYFPATSINSTEMWMAGTFDPATMDRELALAKSLGFNCARVLVQYVVWENDPDGLKDRIDQYLAIASRHGIRSMLIFFDDCYFGAQGPEPTYGPQQAPVIGEYASGFTSSPGPSRILDRAAWPKLEGYVTDVMTRFKDDDRVLMWDLYNEPSNGGLGERSLPLVNAVAGWARAVNPSQPVTFGTWGEPPAVRDALLGHSDVVTFHSYAKPEGVAATIADLKKLGRPMICTEWLNRPIGSTVEGVLPILRRENVGAMHWGLVNGDTQTHLPWGSKPGAPQPAVWQHDLFRADLTPYDAAEIELFKEATAREARFPAPSPP